MTLPTDYQARKNLPLFSGVLAYFPDAIAAVAEVSFVGNQQHNPGQSLHWDRSKSTDHEDCIARHLLERGTIDADGLRHTAKLAWRALALLQLEIEANNVWAKDRQDQRAAGWKGIPAIALAPTAVHKSTVYVAGPMRNKPYYNFLAFDRARDLGIALGYNVISPADIDREHGIDLTTPEAARGEYPNNGGHAGTMDEIQRRDIEAIMSLKPNRDLIVVLEGWEKSTGALAEVFLARWRGLTILNENYELFPFHEIRIIREPPVQIESC